MKRVKAILFWGLVMLCLTLLFGHKNGDYMQSFYFVTMLMPVAVGTTYCFTHFLMPLYLLKKRYVLFGLYLSYTVIISLYLEMLVAVFAFIVLANYQYENMNPLTVDIFTLGITLYLIVFINAFVQIFKRFHQVQKKMEQVLSEKVTHSMLTIQIRVDRKLVPVALDDLLFVESLSDYVKVVTASNTYITREKISHLEKQLPEHFIRIHRSFLVNSRKVASFTRESLSVAGQSLPISRTYKKRVLEFFETQALA